MPPAAAINAPERRSDRRLVAVSDATRLAFERQGFPSRLLETVHNGVDAAALRAAPPVVLRAELDRACRLGAGGVRGARRSETLRAS